MPLEKSKLVNHIEALLFLTGEPMKITRLSKILNKKEIEIKKAINELENNLKDRGINLLKKDKEIMLGTAPDSSKHCEVLTKEELDKNIGRAGLETLVIILYQNGVSRNEIDFIRGVNSTFTLRNLLIRGLVERKFHPVKSSKTSNEVSPKKGYIYTPSILTLQHLGITKKEDLPNYDRFKKELNIDI